MFADLVLRVRVTSPMHLAQRPLESLVAASQAIHQRRHSCRDLVSRCLQRIAARDREVQAWVLVQEKEALQQADRLDHELAAGRDRGPLHGIPIGVKDIIDVEGWPTTAGYPGWADRVASRDAAVVARLREQGAVLLGKTVTTQFAGFDPPPTRNPWNLHHTPGGSSSGSAAAVAAGMCLGALGTQTGGSITRPASFCGDAACKPTFGRVDLRGIVPLSSSMDHVGPIAPTVHDVAVLLAALGDETATLKDECRLLAEPWELPPLSKLRIGRLRGFFETLAEPAMQAAMDRVQSELVRHGATVADAPWPAEFDVVLQDHKKLIAAGAAAYHRDRYLRAPHSFLPHIGTLVSDGLAIGEEEFLDLKQRQGLARAAILSAMDGFDAIVCPAARGTAPDVSTTGDPCMNAPWSFTGLPVVSFRVAWVSGLPLCLQWVGRPFEEAALLRLAASVEAMIDQVARSEVRS